MPRTGFLKRHVLLCLAGGYRPGGRSLCKVRELHFFCLTHSQFFLLDVMASQPTRLDLENLGGYIESWPVSHGCVGSGNGRGCAMSMGMAEYRLRTLFVPSRSISSYVPPPAVFLARMSAAMSLMTLSALPPMPSASFLSIWDFHPVWISDPTDYWIGVGNL